jgi:uncharacterized protein (DUF1501 family)
VIDMAITRRIFVKNGALALVGAAAIPPFLQRTVMAQVTQAQASNKRLVVIFQRGAADGLNIVVPHAEASYYRMRPTIAIPQNQLIDLDGFFGLHPAISAFKPLWDQKHLAIVHATGSPDPTRSHFDAQDYMESGTPGVKATADGWLNRALQSQDETRRSENSPFRAVSLGGQVPRSLEGRIPAVALDNLQNFAVGGKSPMAQPLSASFEAMYDQSVDAVLHGTGKETFDAVKMLKAADPAKYTPAPGANYPGGGFGTAMKQTAQLMKANLGVEAAFADIGGWDTHQNQGAADGQLAGRLREFSQAIAAFWTDMGDQAEDIVLVTMSEFGRTAQQNGTCGTDHGHANVMFVLGGPVHGGRIYGQWPGLAPEQLNEGRDLRVTTDYRRVLAEASYKHLGARDVAKTFPGGGIHPDSFLRIL